VLNAPEGHLESRLTGGFAPCPKVCGRECFSPAADFAPLWEAVAAAGQTKTRSIGAGRHSALAPRGNLRYYTGMNTPHPTFVPPAATAALDVNVAFVSPAARALYLADPEAGLAPATAQAVGLDLRACLTADEAVVRPGARLAVPTGLSVQPHCADVAGFIYSRSGLGARDGLTVAQGVGVVDPDYTGEILVYLLNTSENPLRIKRGDRVAQLIFQPITRPCWREVPSLAATARGAGGFGHTGR